MAKQQALGNHSSLITPHSNIALGSKPKAISHSSLKTHHSTLAVDDTLNAVMLNLFQHLTEWALHLPILKTLKQVQGDTIISAVGNHSSLKTHHFYLAVGFKPKAESHLSLNPFHFYLAESSKLKAISYSNLVVGHKLKATSYSKLMTQNSNLALGLKPTAYSQNIAALSLAFLAMGCSPVLIFFKLCVIYLGVGRFLCALSRKPKAVGKRLRALCNNSLLATGNLKQLVQFLVAGFNPVATKQINY